MIFIAYISLPSIDHIARQCMAVMYGVCTVLLTSVMDFSRG